MDHDTLIAGLAPLCAQVAALDLSRPDEAERALDAAIDPAARAELGRLLGEAFEAGWLCPKSGGAGVFFGRLARPSPATSGLSIDVVEMEGPALAHRHPRGEVSLCFARSGTPRFEGRPPGFVVLPPGSHHVPTVSGGRMLIAYFLPEGAMEWDAA